MAEHQTLLEAAAAAGVMTFPAAVPDGNSLNLARAAKQFDIFTKKAKGRVTLFLGAAISTFKPAQLPMWNDFVELLWTSALRVASTKQPPDTGKSSILSARQSSC